MDKVDIIVDSEFSALAPQKRTAMVNIVTNDGEHYEARVDYPKGEPENPMSLKEVENKFLSLALFGGKTQIEAFQIIERVKNIETDLMSLFDLL